MRRSTPLRQTFATLVVLLLAVGAQPALASSDPLEPQQWGLKKIQSEASWGRSTGAGVIVAVVDTGVNFAHEDLQGASAGSFTCVGGKCVPGAGDDNGHGTWVAGIIAARANNGKGIAGVAPESKILSVKALDRDGVGDLNDVASSIRFAADHGAKVINLSLGSDLPLPIVFNMLQSLSGGQDPFQTAIDDATSKGAAVVAAAGNGALASGFAGMHNLMLVGATGPNDHITGYSASLLGVTLHAPGGEAVSGPCDATSCILTTDKDGAYRAVQGTSFAAPHVSGVIAQLLALGYSPSGAENRLVTTADLGGGFRRLNAAAAVRGIPITSAVPTPPGLPGLPSIGDLSLPALTKLIGLGAGSASPSIPSITTPAGAAAPAVADTAGSASRMDTAPAAGPAAPAGAAAQPHAPAGVPAGASAAQEAAAAPPAQPAGAAHPAQPAAPPGLEVVAGPGPAPAAPAGTPPGHGGTAVPLGLWALFVLGGVGMAASWVRSRRPRAWRGAA
ncbi:MAG TPA: S8 family serine peptidase [Actinomycetota bacterium]